MTIVGWIWCNHQPGCHPLTSRGRRGAMAQHPLVSNAGKGWKGHCQNHTCMNTQNRCFESDSAPQARRVPTDLEFIRAANLVYFQARAMTDARRQIHSQYLECWARCYPNVRAPVIEDKVETPVNDGVQTNIHHAPYDFSAVEGDLALVTLCPASLPISGPPNTQQHVPPIPAAPPANLSFDHHTDMHLDMPSLEPPKAPELTPNSMKETFYPPFPDVPRAGMVEYLRQHNFKVQLLPNLSQIAGGLVPGFQPDTVPTNRIRVVFVEVPDQRLQGSLLVDKGYLTTVNVDYKEFRLLTTAVPLSVGSDYTGGKRFDNKIDIKMTIASSLLIVSEMIDQPELWDLTVLHWELYRDTLVSRGRKGSKERDLWLQLLQQTDLIVGGLPLSGDFLNQKSFPYFPKAEESIEYMISTRILAEKTTIWVNPDDLLLESHKQVTNLLLTQCATSLGLDYPVAVHVPSSKLEATAKDLLEGTRQGVMKRSFSGMAHHVITAHTPKPLQALRVAVQEQKMFWKKPSEVFGKPCWFLQPYMPLLLYLGELRAFVVNGALFHTAYTTPSAVGNPAALDVTSGNIIRPLCTFRYDPDEPNHPSATGWLHVEGSEQVNPVHFAEETFAEFVLNFAGKMILAEERVYKRFSGLRIFARYDVSVYRDRTNSKYKYVVNEVTRCHSTHLFNKHDGETGASDMMINVLVRLLHYVATNRLNGSPPPPHPRS